MPTRLLPTGTKNTRMLRQHRHESPVDPTVAHDESLAAAPRRTAAGHRQGQVTQRVLSAPVLRVLSYAICPQQSGLWLPTGFASASANAYYIGLYLSNGSAVFPVSSRARTCNLWSWLNVVVSSPHYAQPCCAIAVPAGVDCLNLQHYTHNRKVRSTWQFYPVLKSGLVHR